MTPDLQFSDLGSFASCTPMTELGADWLFVNLGDDAMMHGPAVLIEHRYLIDIVEGARADGLTCEG